MVLLHLYIHLTYLCNFFTTDEDWSRNVECLFEFLNEDYFSKQATYRSFLVVDLSWLLLYELDIIFIIVYSFWIAEYNDTSLICL